MTCVWLYSVRRRKNFANRLSHFLRKVCLVCLWWVAVGKRKKNQWLVEKQTTTGNLVVKSNSSFLTTRHLPYSYRKCTDLPQITLRTPKTRPLAPSLATGSSSWTNSPSPSSHGCFLVSFSLSSPSCHCSAIHAQPAPCMLIITKSPVNAVCAVLAWIAFFGLQASVCWTGFRWLSYFGLPSSPCFCSLVFANTAATEIFASSKRFLAWSRYLPPLSSSSSCGELSSSAPVLPRPLSSLPSLR